MIAGEGSQPQIINILPTSSSVGNGFTIQMQRNKYNLKMYCRVQPPPPTVPPLAAFSVDAKLKFGKLREILLLVTVHCSDLFVLRKSLR